MDNVIIKITTGDAPFHIEIDTDPIRTMDVSSTGQYSFIGVPDGDYTITVTDAMNCIETLSVRVGEPVEIITYSGKFLEHECAEDEIVPYLTGLTIGADYSNCTAIEFPRYNLFLYPNYITDFAANYSSTDIEYFEVMGYEAEDSRLEIHQNGVEIQVGDKLYVNPATGDFYLGDLETYITEAIPTNVFRRIQLRYKLRYFDSFSNSAWFRYELDGCHEWTTDSSSTTSTSTTTEPIMYRAAMYVGPDSYEILTEVNIPYQENVQITLNSPIYPGVNFFFISVPEGKAITVRDMMMIDITSEFEYHSDQIVTGYEDNTVYRKKDVFDTTGSTTFYLTINN